MKNAISNFSAFGLSNMNPRDNGRENHDSLQKPRRYEWSALETITKKMSWAKAKRMKQYFCNFHQIYQLYRIPLRRPLKSNSRFVCRLHTLRTSKQMLDSVLKDPTLNLQSKDGPVRNEVLKWLTAGEQYCTPCFFWLWSCRQLCHL